MPTVRILLTADVHSRIENIYRLGMTLQQRRIKPDLTLLCGDLVNVNHDHDGLTSPLSGSPPQVTASSSAISQSLREAAELMAQVRRKQEEEEFRLVLEGMRGITPNLFYIPGNHDPSEAFPDIHPSPSMDTKQPKEASLFKGRPLWQRMQALTGAINFHKRLVSLAPNLLIGGFGGSVPQSRYGQPQTMSLPGYPYSEERLTTGLNDVMRNKRHSLPETSVTEPIAQEVFPNARPDMHILVTHCGPAGVGTTDVNPTPHKGAGTRLESGSHWMKEMLSTPHYQGLPEEAYTRVSKDEWRPQDPIRKGKQARKPKSVLEILFQVHGHSHSAWGLSHLGNIPIINPGPLRDGRYAIATIEHGSTNFSRPWTLTGVEFGLLP